MYTYSQKTGELQHNGVFVGFGYSGTGPGRNNPEMEIVANIGPIPEGLYAIGPAYDDPHHLGPCVMHLDPLGATITFGRTLFRIHGNNAANDASHGCIILGLPIRKKIAAGADKRLAVIL